MTLPQHECRRCGVCCKKGGPSLHAEDRELVENGVIEARYLYTLRKGEPVHDPVRGCIFPLDSELIKIKGKHPAWTCVFFDETENCCRIYASRPLECRVLKCWDIREIVAVYPRNRLTRNDLLSGNADYVSLIETHEQKCGVSRYRQILASLRETPEDAAARQEIQDMLAFDHHLRNLMVEKLRVHPDMLEFLFGRPLQTSAGNGSEQGWIHIHGKPSITESGAGEPRG